MGPQARVQNTSRCNLCGGKAGTRVRLGDESGPVRIAFCGWCDIAPQSGLFFLPPGARLAAEHFRARGQA